MSTNPDNQEAESVEESEEVVGDIATTKPEFNESQHRAETTEKLAFLFAKIFAGALALHYSVYLLLVISGKASVSEISALSDFLHVWLPALTGIVSAAATYYFTKGK